MREMTEILFSYIKLKKDSMPSSLCHQVAALYQTENAVNYNIFNIQHSVVYT